MKKRVFILPLIAVAVLGIGCKQPERQGQPVPNAGVPTESTPGANGQTEAMQGVSRDVIYARQVLRNLNEAQSFRVAMLVPSAGGVINTTLDYHRTNGLIGRVTIPTTEGAQTAELYANKNEIWFKDGANGWTDLSNTDEGRSFNAIFQNAFGYQSQYQSTIADTATLLSKETDPNVGCTRYAFRQTSNNGSEQTFTLCVSADLPVYLTINGPFGQIEIRYRDVNGNVDVKKPV
ncbi:hypothetical protein EDM68_02630 [Candidatus Uhrbacteria bacterium]|nr:MAG: hypothetical protein EDM68_02630 [Candidatus Uhrbacteria bacterium]